MATLLEQTRSAHEEMERLERLVVAELSRDARSHRDRLAQGHRVAAMVDRVSDRAARLRAIYADEDGARKEEIAALGGGENVFSAFYERLKEARDAHRHFPHALAPPREATDAALAEAPGVAFTGEEGGGRYLDLHDLYRAYTNAPWGARVDYLAYLDALTDFGAIARPKKFHASYLAYLRALAGYLAGFQRRAAPLSYPEPPLAAAAAAFAAAWDAGAVRGWEDRGLGGAAAAGGEGEGVLDLDVFDSAEELLTLGSGALKDALSRLGLKAGGTDAERAARLFSTKGRPLASLERKLFQRGAAPPADADAAARAAAGARAIAAAEAEVGALAEMLRGVLRATRGNVEKKTTLSWQELEAERMEEDEDAPEDGEDPENEAIYNPLKLPLGWDGKPIPYWLYKLHGLNQEFNCEICGNFSYWGRRAYERHFREPRHQHGMRCLKIPNTKAFLEVTSIADALALHKAMTERGAATFRADADEEFEDAAGNVYNKKTYLDLQRQGLL